MAKTPAVNPEVKEPVNNGLNLDGLQTAVYKFAGLSGSSTSIAKEIYSFVPNWLDGDLDSSITSRVNRALLLRHKEISYAEFGYAEINGSTHFVKVYELIDGAETQIDPELRKKCKNVMRIDADHALSYTGQEYGKLKTNGDLDKHKAIGEWRTKGSKYMSNVKGEITRKIKSLVAPETKGRAVIADFTDHLTEVFADLKKRCKTSVEARGDTTADPDKFARALKEFWAEYK